MKPQLLQEFEQNKGRTREGIEGVSASAAGFDLQGEFREQKIDMENMATQNGVKAEGAVATDVQNQRSNAQSGVSIDRNTVISSGNTPKEEYNRLQSEHEQGNKNFNVAKAAEDERQTILPDEHKGKYSLDKVMDEMKKNNQ